MKRPENVIDVEIVGIDGDGDVGVEVDVAVSKVTLSMTVKDVGGVRHAYLDEIVTGDMSNAYRYAEHVVADHIHERQHADPPSAEAAVDEDPARG